MASGQDPHNRNAPQPPGRDANSPGQGGRLTPPATSPTHTQSTSGQQNPGGSQTDQMKDKAADTKDKATEAASTAKEKASEATQKATEQVDAKREQAAGAMDTAAVQLRERGESLPGGERTTEMAAAAADKVEATSTYIRDNDVQDMLTDLETVVRSHPTEALIAAGVAGFLVGRMFRS